MRPSNSQIIVNGNTGTAISLNSVTVWAWDIVRCSVQIYVSSGSSVGSVQLQASNQKAVGLPPNQFIPTLWNNIGSGSSNQAISFCTTATSNVFMLQSIETSYEYLRVVYTDNSGGTAKGLIQANLKAFGV